MEPRSDEELVVASVTDEDAFATFYRRHAAALIGFFARRTGDREVSVDLMAETFAAALHGRRRYSPEKGVASAWLYGIARHTLAQAARKGRVEDRARRRLGMPPLTFDDEALDRIESVASLGDAHVRARELLEDLPADQRAAVEARVIDERPYEDIAQEIRCSESVIRKRVSRALSTLRTQLQEPKP